MCSLFLEVRENRMKNSFYEKLKRGISFLLAGILTIQPFFYADCFPANAATEGRGSTYAYFGTQNLLKPGASFPFYGKNHNRVGLWPYGITNVKDGGPAAGFCLEPNKSMNTGTSGTIVSYDLDTDGDHLPLGISREEAEILWYALSSSGNFEGYQGGSAKIGQGHYVLGQCATWAIMSGNWNGLDDFRDQMEVLLQNLKSTQLANETRSAMEQFFTQTTEPIEESSVPAFASKYQTTAPVHTMQKNGDGTYSISLDYDASNWRQSTLIYDLPDGWTVKMESGQITFICSTGNPDIGLVKGHFPEGSEGAKYWVKPTTFKIWYPDGWDGSSAAAGKQAMITMAGEQMPWEIWLSFGKKNTPQQSGDYEIPYTQYRHQETFKRDYQIELEKQCDETGKTLESSVFEVLEQFDFSQLDGTNLEEDQFREMIPSAEGKFDDMTVCEEGLTTDAEGHISHSDTKTYDYDKTYCGGHPDPIIHYVEAGDDASDEESDAADEENERLEKEAWEAWQICVDWCEENCDFHSIDEGVAKDEMEADRDEAWDTFIHLKRIYTVRETTARKGYILHDIHNDDEPIEIVEFESSQVEGDGEVTGHYPGNQKTVMASQRLQAASASNAELPAVSVSPNTVPRLQAAAQATASNAERESTGKSSDTKQEPELEEDVDLENDLASPSNAAVFRVKGPASFSEDDDDEGEGGHWEWDGVQEESEVDPIDQESYPSDYTGYRYLVKDHRTEGELHINKRDMELYEADKEGSYGKSQADATLEGAVYGLYAAEDVIHPDGKTGVVFKSGELVSIAATDKNGDASFLAITEVSDTSKDVPNLYTFNEEKNGNGWIGRPLILGSYYVEEISRSEGYELSKTGKNLTESNRKGKPVVLTETGSAAVSGFFHRINEWTEDFYDFTASYYQTNGFDLILSGLPEDAAIYEVTEKETEIKEQVVTGTQKVEKKDESGNIIYQTAVGGEYKLDESGNKIPKLDEEGNPVYSNQPLKQTVNAVNRLNVYVSEIEREEPSDPDIEESEDIDEDYILWETSMALSGSGYKSALTGYPWQLLKLNGDTNGEMVDEILAHCAADSFWDSYDVETVYEKEGNWYAKIRYGYKALKSPVLYEKSSGRLVVRMEYEDDFYYAVYESGQYEQSGYRFTIEQKKLDETALAQGELQLVADCAPVYETYGDGEALLDASGEKIPVMESVPVYAQQNVTKVEESLKKLSSSYDPETKRMTIHIDTSGEDFSDEENHKKTYRVVTKTEIEQYKDAAVDVTTKKPELDAGSYVKFPTLLYPGQYAVYQDDVTRVTPVLVEQRVIKQAIKVTKDIALDSYKNNTYEIHRDPFTVLFGGYNGKEETKTLPGFSFKLYLCADLEKTGALTRKEDGSNDYEKLFKEHPEYQTSLALEWDLEKYDADKDMTTVHANRGGGKDDYWGQSRMMPYGTYVLVEQQPTGIPQKHYQIDAPQEIEIPFVPEIDSGGTVHDKVPSKEYLYDAAMTPEQLTERYNIRFNEETHIIYAHNNDGDFEVFKYGLEPDLAKDCQNETVAAYYHYGSISENAGKQDGVYYETYYDRDGNLTDYGVTLDNVDTMTGKSMAVDRLYAKALVPWSVLDPRQGEVINDEGDIGNREAGLEEGGSFNFVSFANKDFENELYSSRLRIEKLDAETGDNILHDGALFKIYAAKRDISGDGSTGVTGTGDILFDANGNPVYDEAEQIIMEDDSGAEIGIFKAYTTIRDGEVTEEDGSVHTVKQCVGYLETYQPLGAGAYVLVEIQAPEGYVKSKPIAFTVYSDKVEYYEEGDKDKKTQAVKYQYVRPIGSDGKTVTEDMHQIIVKDKPTHVEIHKVEKQQDSLRYRVDGDEKQLKARGDVELQYKPNGEFAGFGYVTRAGNTGDSSQYVGNATLTLYEGLDVKKTGEHEYEGVKVTRNLFDSVTEITADETGVDTDIRKTGTNAEKKDEWDITGEMNPPAKLWFYDLEYDPTEMDQETGILYGLDDWGNRICMLDTETGMAYVTDEDGTMIVWPLDESGDKIISQSVEVYTDEKGKQTINTDLNPVTDENGLPIYYKDGGVTWIQNEWVTEETPYEIARVKQGAYILEETAAPLADGYVQSAAIGLLVKDTAGKQSFVMEDDFTKIEVSKLDMTSREEIDGAELTLYEAYRVYDDSDRGWHLEILLDSEENPVVEESWISEGDTPHWIDHIMPGDYILKETRVPTEAGYVTSADVEVMIEESGTVQGFVMEDDHTALELFKVDKKTGEVMDPEHRATLALYKAVVNEDGEAQYDENGMIRYDVSQKIFQWQTDDGSEVKKTAHQVTIPGGHSYTAYDYDIQTVPGTEQAICYVTETGAMRFEYLPIGKYVLVEETAPEGYTKADPVYVPVLDTGSKEQVQSITMEDQPIEVLLAKVNSAGGKELAGATVAVYREGSDGNSVKHQMTDENGNLLYVTDLDGNFIKDGAGNLVAAMEYDESYLVERWISGSDGKYTKKEEQNGQIPEGYEVGDLQPHRLKNPIAGDYFFVEEKTPFGYVRAAELPFTITDTMGIQKFEMVDEVIQGQIEIVKSDAKVPEKLLAGARFKFTNLDTNTATILVTDKDGRVVSSLVPIGSAGTDGSVSLYHFRVQEVEAPDGYFLDPIVHDFQFNVKTDRYRVLTYHYGVEDQPGKVIVSKKALTTKEELPGAHLEVRPVTESVDENDQVVKTEGDVIESWISVDTPHEITYLHPGEYVLIETKAPDGYVEAEKIYFTVKDNMTVEETPYVEMYDDDTKTEILKVDQETKDPLAGVTLQLIRKDTMELVKEWVTDKTGSMVLLGLPAGGYLVKEIKGPDGYQLPVKPMEITVTKDYKLQTFVMENKQIEVRIDKLDAEDRAPVSGAVLRLTDPAGNLAAEWMTDGTAKHIFGLKPGSYTLEEIKAPDGYLLLKEPQKIQVTNAEGVQNFTFLNQKLEVDISKKEKETGDFLPGAKLRLMQNDESETLIRKWESGSIPEVFKGLTVGSYILEEVSAPDGYVTGKRLVFSVSGTEEKQEITLENEKIVTEFEKTDGITGEMVDGASLQLIKGAGTANEAIIRKWTSGKEALILKGIPAGTYVIRETKAPEGYVPMEDMEIEILPDVASQQFEIKNQPIQVDIEKMNGDSGTMLGGAALQLVRNSDGKLIREWTSQSGQAEHFNKLSAGTYTIREVSAPSGYKKMDPQEIEITETKDLQEFTVKNYKITHSGGGGGDTPGPTPHFMELYKTDAATGERLAGAKITVYQPDGSIYYEGVTGSSGTIRFERPAAGEYTFKETAAPAGYYLQEAVFRFTVTASGQVEGDTTMVNHKKTELILSKVDVTTAEELPGAEIEVTDQDGKTIFNGISDEHGKVYFEIPAPGEYHFKEVTAPEGYERNETVFTFTVFDDGTVLGDHTITDQKHYGTITASYETGRNGNGDLTVGELLNMPKTGDTSNLFLLLLAWIASFTGLLGYGVYRWRRKGRKKTGAKLGMFLAVLFLALHIPVMEAQAAEETIENVYVEHQYTTDNPDSDDAEKLFDQEIERDGKTFRLSEIKTETIKESGSNTSGTTLQLASEAFLAETTQKRKPEQTITREGETYQLKDYELEETVILAHEVPAEKQVKYEAVEAKDTLPSHIPVSVTDEATGQKTEVQAQISGQKFGEKRWEDTFSFPATFHEYGLPGYWLGGKVYSLDGEQPDFAGYEAELLTLIGAEPEAYTVEHAQWNGEAYEDENKIMCRDATITGKKLVCDGTVTYTGSAVFPEEAGVRYVSTYEKEGTEAGSKNYTMKATGTYVPKKGHGAAVAAVIGLTGASAGAAGYGYYRKKKSGKNI